MKLIFDENLSYRVLKGVVDIYPESTHVTRVGLAEVSDRALWDYAAANGYVLVTKDDDFQRMSILLGLPPKVIWLNVGNASTTHIIHIIRSRRAEIQKFIDQTDATLLVLE